MAAQQIKKADTLSVQPLTTLVEIWGFEPQTYTLRTYRATNCAISPYGR